MKMNDKKLRSELTKFMNITINKIAPTYKVIAEENYSDYHEYLIEYEGTENSIISAYLLIPKLN